MKDKIQNAVEAIVTTDKDKPINWEALKRMFELWVRKYPEEAKQFYSDLKDMREAMKDPRYGRSEVGGQRLRFIVPESLDVRFTTLEPGYCTKKNIERFLKEFPVFKLTDK